MVSRELVARPRHTYNTYHRNERSPGLARHTPHTILTSAKAHVNNPFSTIEEAVDAIRNGRIVVVVDAEDRENEGDFVCAAEKATAEAVNFMITHGRGQLCMPILPEISQRLGLHPMVEANTAPLGTNYTVPVDHRSTRTGITAAERARTIQSICDPTSKPTDFTRPGHLFPLVAKEGGVLRRAGHTEAAVDLARMAGLLPAGVLCEILDESGDRANREQLHDLARQLRSADHFDRAADRVSPRAREAGLSRGRSPAAHEVRHRHDHFATA